MRFVELNEISSEVSAGLNIRFHFYLVSFALQKKLQ